MDLIDKLYIVARADLSPGLQAAQCCHAALLFRAQHPEAGAAWYENSNNIVLLQVPCLHDLERLFRALDGPKSLFTEPDLGDEATALATLDRKATRRLSLLLQLKAA